MSQEAGWEASRRPLPLRTIGLALVTVAVVALLVRGGGAPAVERPDPDGELLVTEASPAPGPDATRDVVSVADGRVTPLQTAPVRPPVRAHGVFTGTELVVFGAGGQVAAYDAAHRLWWRRASLPEVPGRTGPTLAPVWDGREVMALSGPASDAVDARMTAAAFDPAQDRWRLLPSPPVVVVAPAVSVWAGQEWIVWGRAGGPRVREDGPPVGAAYDPATGAWRRLPEAPVLLVDSAAGVAIERGAVVMWGRRADAELSAAGRGAFALRYAPDGDRWIVLPDPPLSDPAGAAAVWTGSCAAGASPCGEILLWGAPLAGAAPSNAPRGGASLDVAAGTWTLLPSPPGEVAGTDRRAAWVSGAWTGTRLLLVGGTQASRRLSYDPADRRWSALPAGPAREAPLTAWTGEELLIWGGVAPGGPSSSLQAWRVSR